MKSILQAVVLIFLSSLLACNIAERALNRGDYDIALQKAAKKLSKDKQSGYYASIMNQAYLKLYEEDMNNINLYRKQGAPENKLKIFDVMSRIQSRHNTIKYLLPLGGYIFPTIDDQDYIAAKNEAAEYLLVRSTQLLNSGNKQDARAAYGLLQNLRSIYPGYKNVKDLEQQALILGSNYVWMRMTAPDNVIMPQDFQQRLLALNSQELNGNWMYFTPTYDSTLHYDYYIIVKLTNVAVLPEQLIINNYTENAQVEDGFDYVLDDRGNVKKDSLGNDIKRKKYRTITCLVSDRQIHKEVTIGGFIDIYNTNTQQLLKSINIGTNVVFDAHSAIANGDLNALSPRTRQLINTVPPPVPNDFTMLYDAAERLKMILFDKVKENRYIFN